MSVILGFFFFLIAEYLIKMIRRIQENIFNIYSLFIVVSVLLELERGSQDFTSWNVMPISWSTLGISFYRHKED